MCNTVVEPYDLYSWMVILVGTVHTVGFFILLFDYLSPPGEVRYTGNDWKGQFELQQIFNTNNTHLHFRKLFNFKGTAKAFRNVINSETGSEGEYSESSTSFCNLSLQSATRSEL